MPNPFPSTSRALRHVAVAVATAIAISLAWIGTALATESSAGGSSSGPESESGEESLTATTGLVTSLGASTAVAAAVEATRQEAPATTTTTAPPPPPLEPECPVPGSEFVNSWGFARSGGRRHKGVDMMAPHGAPVLAPVDGHVRTHESRLGGRSFYLVKDDGTEFYGAHLDSYGATGWVQAGDVIGYVGSTGNASRSAPHLHFEIHPGGNRNAVNPYPWVAEWCAPDPVEPDLALVDRI